VQIDAGAWIMTDSRINVYQILRVVAVVTQYGKRENGVYILDGLTCITSEDGYTVTLTNGTVEVSVFFHNTFELKVDSESELEQFQLTVDHIEREDKAGRYSKSA
jgi:hypothetical protein